MKAHCTTILIALIALAIPTGTQASTGKVEAFPHQKHLQANRIPAVDNEKPTFASGYLLNRDYRTGIIPFKQTQELRKASSILVDPAGLLRSPPPFRVIVSEDEPLEVALNRIIPEVRNSISPQELAVIVIKSNSIQRLRIGSVREGTTVTPEKTQGIRISPGEIILMDVLGY